MGVFCCPCRFVNNGFVSIEKFRYLLGAVVRCAPPQSPAPLARAHLGGVRLDLLCSACFACCGPAWCTTHVLSSPWLHMHACCGTYGGGRAKLAGRVAVVWQLCVVCGLICKKLSAGNCEF